MADAFRGKPYHAVLTVGRGQNPEDLDAPTNVRVENYVPNAVVIRAARAVVNHGGNGTVLGSLAAGKPMVIVPFFADQPVYAQRCADLGAALTVPPERIGSDALGEAVDAVMNEPVFAESADRVRAEFDALPSPAGFVGHAARILRSESLQP